MYICQSLTLRLKSMKRLFALFLAISALLTAHAQAPRDSIYKPLKRPLTVSVTYGRSINTGGNDNEYWFGRQPGNHGELGIQLSYLFINHCGIFADMYFSAGGNWVPPIDIEWMNAESCGPVGSMGMGVGLMYRFENYRWQFFARTGIGSCSIDNADDLFHNITEENNDSKTIITEVLEARRLTCPSYVNFGITGGYRLTHELSIVLDVNYRYPYTSSTVIISRKTWPSEDEPSQVINQQMYHSRSWGNNITISLGFRVQFKT